MKEIKNESSSFSGRKFQKQKTVMKEIMYESSSLSGRG